MEETVHENNKELMKIVIQKIPDIAKKIVWQEAIRLLHVCSKVFTTNPVGWIFEKNENGKGYYLKSSSSGGYYFVTSDKQINIIGERQNSDNFYWTLEEVQIGLVYRIVSVKTGKRLGLSENRLILDSYSTWQLN